MAFEWLLFASISSHFLTFSCKPISAPLVLNISTSPDTVSACPPRVASSMKSMVKSEDGEIKRGCIVKEKRKESSGSLFFGPSLERRKTAGKRGDRSLVVAQEFAHLAASLRHTQPTAMGRIPPDFFSSARRLPPKRIGMTRGGKLPSRKVFKRN